MTNAIKGVLLSRLVFPGLGQIALKRYQRGVVFMLATVAGLVVIVVNAAREARRILGTIEAGGGVIDQDAMSRAIDQTTAWSGNLAVNLFLVAITFWEMVSVWVQDSSATPVSWGNQEARSCTWHAITDYVSRNARS